MAFSLTEFTKEPKILFLVQFSFSDFIIDSRYGYIWDQLLKEKQTCLSYIHSQVNVNEKKISQVLLLVHLPQKILSTPLSSLTKLETKKLKLAILLLQKKQVILCEHFFEDMIFQEREYFLRFFRALVSKKQYSFLFLERNLNYVCEMAKGFFWRQGKHYEWITDFYDDRIYDKMEMPYAVSLIKYLESCGHKIDHEITIAETLKAIYRGV